MGWGDGNLGGGSAGLNFKVVGGTSQPSSPSENTIWINTDVPVSGYIFSATEPEETSDGIVWIYTGTQSDAEFNALKKNGIKVYPISSKQRVSGAWVDKTAKSYQNGAWRDWVRHNVLYESGDENEKVTGGWVDRLVGLSSDRKRELAIVRGANNLSVSAAVGGGSMITTKNKINLSNWSKIVFTGKIESYSDTWCRIAVWTEIPSASNGNIAAELKISAGTHTSKKSLDVSGLSGSYYVGFLLDSSSIVMTSMKLE